MKRSDIVKIAVAAGLAALISFVVSGILFNSPSKHNQKVPVVQTINTSFPDVANDPTYKTIFNTSSIDPTQPVHVGSSQNTSPFNTTP